jgi:hypothetical protein
MPYKNGYRHRQDGLGDGGVKILAKKNGEIDIIHINPTAL